MPWSRAGRPRGKPPPPPRGSQVPRPVVVLCLRHACDVRATEGRRKGRPNPPNTTTPPRANAGREGAKSAPPPPEDNAAGWGGRGRRVWDEPHDRARRGRAPCKPRRGDHRGCGRRIEGATEGAARQTPPPPAEGREPRLVLATRGQRQENDKAPPPPHASAPPRVGVAGREGRAAAPPLQRGGHRGSARSVDRAKTRATRRASHPSRRTSAVPRASAVPATCLRRRKGNEGAPPPPPRPHLPHPPRTEARATGRRRGNKRDDGSGRRTPPRRGGETEGRDDRAQGGHAPCKPPRGDRRGCNRRKGRVTTGAARQPPPPPAEGQVPCLVPAPCFRRACTKGRTARMPPPPAPFSNAHPQKGRGRRGDSERTWKKKKKKTQSEQPRTPTRQSRDRQQGQTGHGGSQGAQQGARVSAPGDESWDAGTNGGGRGDKSPRTTLVRYPTSGVWGPPRCPYRHHLSASNKVGYARDRWPAARGGTGLGGWPMGLTKSTPHGTYCGSCPVRGCG